MLDEGGSPPRGKDTGRLSGDGRDAHSAIGVIRLDEGVESGVAAMAVERGDAGLAGSVLGKDGATSVGGSPCNGKDTGRLSGEGRNAYSALLKIVCHRTH